MVRDLLHLRVESKSQIEVVYISLLDVLDDIEGMRLEVLMSRE